MITIDSKELGIDYRDSGPWRSYYLGTFGDTAEELLANAIVEEVDQDAGELRSYPIEDASTQVYDVIERVVLNEYKKATKV